MICFSIKSLIELHLWYASRLKLESLIKLYLIFNNTMLNKVILKELFRTFFITDDIFSVPLHQRQQVVIQIIGSNLKRKYWIKNNIKQTRFRCEFSVQFPNENMQLQKIKTSTPQPDHKSYNAFRNKNVIWN